MGHDNPFFIIQRKECALKTNSDATADNASRSCLTARQNTLSVTTLQTCLEPVVSSILSFCRLTKMERRVPS